MSENNRKSEEYSQGKKIPLLGGLDLQSLLDGTTFSINVDAFLEGEDKNSENSGMNQYVPCPIDDDESDTDDNRSPFEKLASKMTNVTPDGKVKKLVKREGKGSTPLDGSFVNITYLSYLEYFDEPTDSRYFTEPYHFQLGTSGIAGLDFGVATMKAGEKAQFLIHWDYTFGRMGHPPRIPPEATFLYQVELLSFSGSAVTVPDITQLQIEKKTFADANKFVVGIMDRARRHFKYNNKLAIYDYNRAVAVLDNCEMKDLAEQEEQQKLLLKLDTNLAVCLTKTEKASEASETCNRIYDMTKNTNLRVPAKVYYHHARAYSLLGNLI